MFSLSISRVFLLCELSLVCLPCIDSLPSTTHKRASDQNDGLPEALDDGGGLDEYSSGEFLENFGKEIDASPGDRRQFIGPVFPQHHVHIVPKPFPVVSVKYVPRPVPVFYPVAPHVHVSHVHVKPRIHLNPCQNGGIFVQMAHGYFCICHKDFRGKNCEDRNYCASSPCKNGATCVEVPATYKCVCPQRFLGPLCEAINPCHPNPCKNGGTCSRSDTEDGFVCTCKEGFKGHQCDSINRCDPNPCKNGATCLQDRDDKYSCICLPGFRGTLCDVHRRCYENPCLNGGTCYEDDVGYNCTCTLGHRGLNCESHVCRPNPCFNGGHCRLDSGHFKCDCPHLFRGDHCEIPHPCHVRPCLNGGVCIDSYSGYSSYPEHWNHGFLHYLCLCEPGFIGSNCEEDVCKRCDINAKCLNNTCVCIDGFTGDGFKCRKIPHPCHPNPCFNEAKCKELANGEFDCVCRDGTTGKYCEDKNPCTPNPCKNEGKCLEQAGGGYKCVCENGFTGANCETPIEKCTADLCQNGGTCVEVDGKAVCKCPGHFGGPLCKECTCPKGDPSAVPIVFAQTCDALGECRCSENLLMTQTGCISGAASRPCDSSPCKNGGTCQDAGRVEYTCKCTPEYKGKNCETLVCPDGYCLNGGICEPVNGQPTCICQNGFTGPRCGIPKTITKRHCHPNPCLNGGACTEAQEGYDCHCKIQFTGAHCEVDKCTKCDVNAICNQGRCRCRAGYIGTGYECARAHHKRCPALCPLYSTCLNGVCACHPGYQMQGNSCVLPVYAPTPPPAPPPPPPPPVQYSAYARHPQPLYYYSYNKREKLPKHRQNKNKSSV